MIEFTVYNEVLGKARPRFKRVGNYVQTYTDEKTVNYENLVKLSYVNSNCESYLEGEPLWCEIKTYFTPPKSTSNKKRKQMLEGTIRPTKKPDPDNIAKGILDALNKVAFNDDTQIVSLIVTKEYGIEDKAIIKIGKVYE